MQLNKIQTMTKELRVAPRWRAMLVGYRIVAVVDVYL
jgi:hypothetical protein